MNQQQQQNEVLVIGSGGSRLTMTTKTLRDCIPLEWVSEGEKRRAPFLRDNADVAVVREVDGCVEAWPGKHKNVLHWYVLANGYAVGWNESPSHGWSFPVVRLARARPT